MHVRLVNEPVDLHIEPAPCEWAALLDERVSGTLDGHDLGWWRETTRRELGLDTERPIIGTGHQALLWHPGILVKFIAVDRVASMLGAATANLVVDQHAGGFADLLVPVTRQEDGLAERVLHLARAREQVPMVRHAPFVPDDPGPLRPALPSVAAGILRIVESMRAHANAPNAAAQMADVMDDLMSPWAAPMPRVTASCLMRTTLARTLMRRMADEPQHAAEAYNRAVRAVPGAGIGPLVVRDDWVELPLWRLRDDDSRMHAWDNDVANALERDDAPALLPRALFMTALVRLAMCDLFVHGTGGANYDRAMEIWIRDWLGVDVAPIAVATATMRLPFEERAAAPPLELAQRAYRRVWHDPELGGPGATKREIVAQIESLPRRSVERRAAFMALHERLGAMRESRSKAVGGHSEALRRAEVAEAEAPVRERRTWAFSLYGDEALGDLAAAVEGLRVVRS